MVRSHLKSSRENQQTNIVFENRDNPTRKCYLFPIVDVPVTNDGHEGQLKRIFFSIYIFTIF